MQVTILTQLFITFSTLQIAEVSHFIKELNTVKRNTAKNHRECFYNETRCLHSHECIHNTQICDGKYDCDDDTDEGYFCLEPADRCPSYMFRCGYGACVDKSLECNGINDCILDGTDEQTINCPGVSWEQTCGKGSFTCKNKECISSIYQCDGRKDCIDGSDESFIVCHEETCFDFSFRCGYGACVRGDAKCDRIVDCEGDGSDEEQVICGYSKPIYNETCKYPEQPENGFWNLFGISKNKILPYPGKEARNNTSLLFKCDKNYLMYPKKAIVHCKYGRWSTNFPKCYSKCPPRISKLIDIKCSFQNEQINCLQPVPHGTIANMSCPPLYKQGENQINLSKCNGTAWDTDIMTCYPICGKETQYNSSSSRSKFPWHIGVYRKQNDNYIYMCGGTIITPYTVISAAHCFSDILTGECYAEEEFFIGAGKYYKKLDDPRDTFAQIIQVKNILLGEKYKGMKIHFIDDIAVVILKSNFTINDAIQPVCIDWGEKYLQNHFVSRYPAETVGWGITDIEGHSNYELRNIQVPFQTRIDCYSMLPSDLLSFFTGDKFCAGETNSTNLCSGDSGGGLVFYEKQTKSYFLRGIASIVANQNSSCNHKYPGLYVNINHYLSFIKRKIK